MTKFLRESSGQQVKLPNSTNDRSALTKLIHSTCGPGLISDHNLEVLTWLGTHRQASCSQINNNEIYYKMFFTVRRKIIFFRVTKKMNKIILVKISRYTIFHNIYKAFYSIMYIRVDPCTAMAYVCICVCLLNFKRDNVEDELSH